MLECVPLHSVQVEECMVLPQVDFTICHSPEMIPKAFLASLGQDPFEQFTYGLPTPQIASLCFGCICWLASSPKRAAWQRERK